MVELVVNKRPWSCDIKSACVRAVGGLLTMSGVTSRARAPLRSRPPQCGGAVARVSDGWLTGVLGCCTPAWLRDCAPAIGLMCGEDLAWLNDWRPRYRRSDDAILSRTGWTELREIGQWDCDCLVTQPASRCWIPSRPRPQQLSSKFYECYRQKECYDSICRGVTTMHKHTSWSSNHSVSFSS